jgi:hypothetical protein
MLDPDLSTTLPEKLPFAWPYMTGEKPSTRAQATTIKNILFVIFLVEASLECGHSAPIIVCFIVTLSITSDKAYLALNSRDE